MLAVVSATVAVAMSGCEFWQYNIANGGTPPKTKGQEDIKWMVASGARPVAMTLEEVCGHRFNEIALRSCATTATAAASTTSAPAAAAETATATRSSTSAAGLHSPAIRQASLKLIYTTNNRPHRVGAMAVAIGAGSSRAIVWVTHLEASDDSAASNQAWELLQSVHYWRDVTGWLPVVGGDFNLTPNQFPMPTWCARFREAFSCSSSSPTHAAGKIDYLFSPVWKWGRTYISANSDHRRLAAGITGSGPSG